MNYDPHNIFAKILRREIPNKTVYEDDFTLSFHDIAPLAPIHVLVIPKGEFIDFSHFSAQANDAMKIGFYHGLHQTIEKLNLQNGYRLVANTGTEGGQEVPHFHIHILSGKIIPA